VIDYSSPEAFAQPLILSIGGRGENRLELDFSRTIRAPVCPRAEHLIGDAGKSAFTIMGPSRDGDAEEKWEPESETRRKVEPNEEEVKKERLGTRLKCAAGRKHDRNTKSRALGCESATRRRICGGE
jgi:hypothetical protein